MDDGMGAFDFLYTLSGPDFLVLYTFWLIITRLAVTILRRQGLDHALITLGGIVLYEGLGVLRIWIGSMHDLHQWDILLVMMFGGFLLFLIRMKDFGDRSSGGSCSGAVAGGGCGSSGHEGTSGIGGGGDSGASGGGCGASSCGGGGCGGCGGS